MNPARVPPGPPPFASDTVSTEPLRLIRAIEADTPSDHPTSRRFRRLFNELHQRDAEIDRLRSTQFGHDPLSD